MIEIMSQSSKNVLGLKASGMLTDADYRETLVPQLESAFEKHGRLRLLFYMDEFFEGWNLEAAWDDVSLGLKHRADFEKIALVGGPAWVRWAFKLSAFLMKGEIKDFGADELEAAWKWVRD